MLPAIRRRPAAAAITLVLSGLATSAVAAVPAPGGIPAGGLIAVRTGDPAPVAARIPSQFGCGLGVTATGGRVFCDAFQSAVYLQNAGTTTIVVYAGQTFPGGAIERIYEVEPSPDGSLFLVVQNPGGGSSLLRLPPGGGPLALLLSSSQVLRSGRGAPLPIGAVRGLAVDGSGRAIVGTGYFYPGSALPALVRVSPVGRPEILIRSGDPLGGGTLRRIVSVPGVSGSGTIAFAAELGSLDQVIATLAPGSAPVVLASFPGNPGYPGPLEYSAPAINDAGDVAFILGWDANQMELRRIVEGVSSTIAGPGFPAPRGGTFSSICCARPAIDPEGGVLFGGYRNYPSEVFLSGLYRATDVTETIAESLDDVGDGTILYTIHLGPSPALASDGTVLFAAWDTAGYGLYSRSGTTFQSESRAGGPVSGSERFVSLGSERGVAFGVIFPPRPPFFISPFPYLGGGPFLSAGGRMIFDARLTGGTRGLFLREPDGTLAAVALDGDPPSGGGLYGGEFLSYHSINDTGTVAFFDHVLQSPTAPGPSLFYGPAAGPLARLVGLGDPVPGSEALVAGFLPPSRVGADGSMAVPLYLSDETVVLFGWDGSQLVRVAGPGDEIPGEGAIESILMGVTGRLLPPLLDNAGEVVFEATTTLGGQSLYRAPLRAGGVADAVRVLGQGDPVEGGVLSSLALQIVDLDPTGRMAFQTPAPGGSGSSVEAVTYLGEPGGVARRVVGPGDLLASGPVTAVVPHVALAGSQRLVHEVEGPWLLLSAPASVRARSGFRTTILAGPGLPSPDGGTYLRYPYVFHFFPRPSPGAPPGASETQTAALPDRLGSDGDHLVAWRASTTLSPSAIVLFDLNAARSRSPRQGPSR